MKLTLPEDARPVFPGGELGPTCPDCGAPLYWDAKTGTTACLTEGCPCFDRSVKMEVDATRAEMRRIREGAAVLSPEQRLERTARVLDDEVAAFRKSPWWAIENGFVLTEDEHAKDDESPTKPFPTHEYLKALTRCHEMYPIGLVMKSRQLMITWLFCWLLLWRAVSRGSQLCIAQGKREEDVIAKGTKALMGRIRFMRRHLPKHLQPVVTEETKTTEVYANSSTIWAIPQGDDIIRSNTASENFFDELARHQYGEAAWTAGLPTIRGGGKQWGATTPNGREFCYQQGDERLPFDLWETWPEICPGLHGYQNAKGIFLLALHYSADPTKRTVEFQVEARRGYTNGNFYRQEMELDFSLQSGEGVYAEEFRQEFHVLRSNYVANPYMPIYRCWDFGYTGQACIFFQYNHRGQIVWFDTVFLKRVALQRVCQEVLRRTLVHTAPEAEAMTEVVDVPLHDMEGREIEGARLAQVQYRQGPGLVLDFGDPSAETHNPDGTTARDTLLTYGITLRTRSTTGRKGDLIEGVRALLLPRSDGTPGLLISPGPSAEQRYVIDAFKGGYRYPPATLGRADKVLPAKDGFYDHLFDAAQYGIDHVRPIRAASLSEVGEGADWWKEPMDDNPWNGEVEGYGTD